MAGTAETLQLGFFLPTWDDERGRAPRWEEIRSLAQHAEAIGVDTLWVGDHFRLHRLGRALPFWEAWSLLPAIAEATTTVTLGPLVAVAAFRHPALLARMAVTLDEVSGGRLILGLGAGSDRDASIRALGYPVVRRASILEEALQILVPLLRDGYVDYQGQYFQTRDCHLDRQGPRPAGPPVWIGGTGPRSQRLAARWAAAFHFNGNTTDPRVVSDSGTRFDAICQAVGRDPSTVGRAAHTIISFAGPDADMTGLRAQALRGTVEDIAAQLHALNAAGIQHMTCSVDPGEEQGPLTALPHLSVTAFERFAPVIAALRRAEAKSVA